MPRPETTATGKRLVSRLARNGAGTSNESPNHGAIRYVQVLHRPGPRWGYAGRIVYTVSTSSKSDARTDTLDGFFRMTGKSAVA